MSSSLSSIVDDLSDINGEKCDNRLEYVGFRDNYLLWKFSDCNAWFKKDSKELIKIFANNMNFVIKTLINLFWY